MPSALANNVAESIDEALWFGTDDPSHADSEARASVAAEVARISGLKPFPVVAAKVLQQMSDEGFSVPRVAALVEQDPALAAMVIRLVNSALYGRGKACRSVEQSIVRLGADKVRQLVAGAATMQMFAGLQGIGVVFRDHCSATAAVVRVLGQEHNVPGHEDLFLAGLLHDVGKLLLLETREFDYTAIDATALVRPGSVHGLERSKLGYDHAVLGAQVLREWAIPDPIPQIVAWHHQPVRAYNEGGMMGAHVSLLRVADAIAWYLDHTQMPSTRFIDHIADGPDGTWVGLTGAQIESMWTRLVESRAEAMAIFKA